MDSTPTPVAAETETATVINGLTGGMDGTADSSSVVGADKKERKRAKEERKRKEKHEKLRKGYLTPKDQQSSDPVKPFTAP